ncbi:MAG: alpha/beta hydrolase [Armatimonadetes bacterium]|nr:alpha/beta hydrolase [Armatimonadota bacterium]
MGAHPRPISEEQWSAILDREGHEPCPGVLLQTGIEIPGAEDGPAQTAVLYTPEEPVARPMPAVLAFHGGGYCMGDPFGMGAFAKAMALALGVATFSASYRLGTEASPTGPAIVRDAVSAWNHVRSRASDYGIAPERIAVAGESAGCLLAGHLAVGSPLVRGAEGRPIALYSFWGPLDFVARWYDNGQSPGAEVNIFGPGGFPAHPALYHWVSPLTHASDGPLPPALLVYGSTDAVVHPRQAALAAAAWREARSHAEEFVVPNIGHGVEGDNRGQRRRVLERAIAFGATRHVG